VSVQSERRRAGSIDLNDESGQTTETVADLRYAERTLANDAASLFFGWPTGRTDTTTECLDLVDPCHFDKAPNGWPDPSYESTVHHWHTSDRDFSSFGQFDLEDLGMDNGITELPFGFDPTDQDRFSSFSLSIDGQDISSQELLDFSDDVRCLFRTGQSITVSYVEVNQSNFGGPTETDFTEYELTASMDQNIDSLEYIFA
jgi:hypothetical protein